jgi:hypothetical protein
VNSYTTSDQSGPSLALKSDGSFVVAGTAAGEDGDSTGSSRAGSTAAASPLGEDFQVNQYTVGAENFPDVRYEPGEEGFAVVWQSATEDGSGLGVFGRGFDSDGTPDSDGELQLNAYTTDDQGQPVLVSVGNNLVIVWHSDTEDGSSYGIFARSIGDTGFSDEVQLNTFIPSFQSMPRAAAAGQRFVVVWQSAGQDGSNFGVFGRRFVLPGTLDVDGDGDFLPLTDSLLILRYTFGFRGATLTSGAVGPNCTRCDATAIEAYWGRSSRSVRGAASLGGSGETRGRSPASVGRWAAPQPSGGGWEGARCRDEFGRFGVLFSSALISVLFASPRAGTAGTDILPQSPSSRSTPTRRCSSRGRRSRRTARALRRGVASGQLDELSIEIMGRRFTSAGAPWAATSRSTPTPRATSSGPRSPAAGRALSWWSGSATGRTATATASSRVASTPRATGRREFQVSAYTAGSRTGRP